MKVWFVLLFCGLALATAARYDDDLDEIDDIDIDEPDTGLVARLKAGLQRALDRVKTRLERNKDLMAEFGDRFKDISKSLLEVGKDAGRKSMDKIRVINRKIRDLTRDILRRGGIRKRDTKSDLLRIVKEIKKIILTPAGYHEFKNHLLNLKSVHPIVNMMKSYIANADDDDLYGILSAALNGIPDFYKVRRETTKLEGLFHELMQILKTVDGVEIVYHYFVDLQTDHPILRQLQLFLETVDRGTAKDIFLEIVHALEEH